MNQNAFKEDDKKKVIDFLNLVATHAEFKLKTPEIIEFFKLLAYMQKELLPKIDSHIFEVKRVISEQETVKEKKKSK